MKKKSGLIAIALLLIGCAMTSREEHSGIAITVPLSETDHPLPLSEIVDSLQYIKLETSDECLIGNIDKLFATRDRLILLDSENAKSIYLFNHQGEFINKVGRIGQGPNEYLSIYDIAVNEKDEQIIVWDATMNKLLIYRFDGTFVETIPFTYYGNDIEYMGDNLLAFYCDYQSNEFKFDGDTSANLIIFNMKSREVTFDLYFDNTKIKQENFVSTLNNFSRFRGEVLLLPTLSNSIYVISPNGGSEKYYLDYGLPFEMQMANYIDHLASVSAVEASDFREKSGLPFSINFISSDNLIYMLYVRENTYYCGFYYPESKTFKEASLVFPGGDSNRIPMRNDLDNTRLPFMPIAADPQGHFYYVIDSYVLEYFKDNQNADIQALVESSTPNDNPIIVKTFTKKQ